MSAAPRSPRPRYVKWLLFACALFLLGLFSLGTLYLYLRATHRAIGAGPAQPPAVTSLSTKQGQRLLQELAKHPALSLTIKTDASDRAANQLAHQFYDVLRNSQWHVELSTDDIGPPIGTGLCIAQTGEASRPPYPETAQDPYFFLPAAFAAAHIDVNSESGQSSGSYKLYLVVGHRDQSQPALRHGYIARAAARWFLRHLKALRRA